ncbi:MAG: DUF4335 domain-containing protein [Cyanobacteria bacterium J06623_1]
MPTTIQRFTPPTCTLEITNQRSLLPSRANLAHNHKIQFQLRFDDPRQPTAKQVMVQGNRQQLIELKAAVEEYVQTQLTNSLRPKSSNTNVAQNSTAAEQLPRIKPLGLVQHEFFFGSLTHDGEAAKIKLGTVQLFDLLTALEAAETAVIADEQRSQTNQNNLPLWGSIAAVAIAAISLSIFLRPQVQQQVASGDGQPEPQAKIPELNEITPPVTPERVQKPDSVGTLQEPLASTQRLPPPPAVETPKPQPDIPDPADYPLADVARQSGLDNPSKGLKLSAQPNNQAPKSALVTPENNQSESIIPEEIPIDSTLPPVKFSEQNQSEIAINIEDSAPGDADLLETEPDLAIAEPVNQPSAIEQVAAYFEERWQPPADLRQGLEYRLFFNLNGSIKRVVPLGKAAQFYLDQTNIPVDGEKLIFEADNPQPPIVRLLLDPDGRVHVFAEPN